MRIAVALLLLACIGRAQPAPPVSPWTSVLRDSSGQPLPGALVELRSGTTSISARTGADGRFSFPPLPPRSYILSVRMNNLHVSYPQPLSLPNKETGDLVLSSQNSLSFHGISALPASGGGEDLSARSVSEIPLNKRDFSQLLLLAAGTMTDANGTTNFTQQFAINGQRGVEAVFALDGADISDPEMGGATFSNFNVDAVGEIQSASGWMPAEVGRGAAGFTNIVSRAGTKAFHGSAFEFLRNSALDARNFFDRRSAITPERIPPFRRNEFGFTIGGPVLIPRLLTTTEKTFFFAEYQGFRQVLGTTQVMPVPTAAERAGLDSTAFPGDTLLVPVNPRIAALIDRYPLPNDTQGPFGARTFATSSKVTTNADQFSVRIDHKLSAKDSLFFRYTRDNLTGPTTNPDQTAVDPSFGVLYVDHQQNAALTWTRAITSNVVSDSSLSVTRTTPSFPTPDHTDPALTFGDNLYESFNSAAGSVMASYGNLFQGRQNFSWTKGKHAMKAGVEFRANRDTTYFGTAPNGSYTFGGGTAYSPVTINSESGAHQIRPGDPLPDTLTALLTGSAFAYTIAVAAAGFPQGDQIGVAAISRYGINLFVQDTWKLSDRWVIDYGLRYELYTPISERAKRTAGVQFGNTAAGLEQQYLINPQPRYQLNSNGWGPRLRIGWLAADKLWIRAAGGLTTIPPNIWQDNLLTGAAPYVDYPRLTASPGAPLLFGTSITPQDLPGVYSPNGANILASGNSNAVPANAVWDIDRFETGIAALNPGHQITPLNVNAISQDFRNAYLASWSFSLERQFRGLTANAAYVGTAGISLPAINYPNGYPGASPAFAPYTTFDSSGQPSGGFGTELLMTNRSHSSYHALQTSLAGTVPGGGPNIQASYTWSKSLDDVSTVIGGIGSGSSGAIAPPSPQDPLDTRAEKGPSTFDIGQAFSLSAIQDLHAERLAARFLGQTLTSGWQLLSVSTITSGAPFSVLSGVQQTGAGSNGVDRPDQVAQPDLSTSRNVREDYFGSGANNASFFLIPINVPGGTGPNQGVFGTLGRDTFRGPAFYNFDFALIKDTPLALKSNREFADLQFRAEFFNLFNVVNLGLPANVTKGSGFGEINHTAGNSRQIQFSLKMMF